MAERLDPRDTIRVTGGRTMSKVDAHSVRESAYRTARTEEFLLAAAAGLDRAADAAANQPIPSVSAANFLGNNSVCLAPVDPMLLQARTRAVASAREVSRTLRASATQCQVIRDRILRAAGLFEETETRAAAVFSGAVRGYLTQQTLSGVRNPVYGVLFSLAVSGQVIGLWAMASLIEVFAEGRRPKGLPEFVYRLAAPYFPELVDGIGTGIAMSSPKRAQGEFSLTGGANVLASLLEDLRQPPGWGGADRLLGALGPLAPPLNRYFSGKCPAGHVEVREVRPKRTPLLAGAVPEGAWNNSPTGNVRGALARIELLHPYGGPGDGLSVGGLSQGTLAVERVTHADGSHSWTVLIPGTQGFSLQDQPFDGLTNIQLVAQWVSDVEIAVVKALAEAGAQAGEVVALAGHSQGGIVAATLAASPAFRGRFQVGGVVTAGSPTDSLPPIPPGTPVLHLVSESDLVPATDGRRSRAEPPGADQVTITQKHAASNDPRDQVAAGSVSEAHPIPTYQKLLQTGVETGNYQVHDVLNRLEAVLGGEHSETRFFAARRQPKGERGGVDSYY